MVIKQRWRCAPPAGMGDIGKSRTLRIKDFDIDGEDPRRTYLILRAWKLWRAQHGGFKGRLPARRSWYMVELERLRRDVKGMGIAVGGAGSADADG